MASPFEPMVLGLEQLGVYLYLFPFLLTLAIVYGILSYSLKEQLPTSARGLVSVIVAFFVMLFSLWNPFIVLFFANVFGYGLIVGSGLLMIIIVLGLMGIKPEDLTKNEKFKWPFVGVMILIFVLVIAGVVGTSMLGLNAGSGEFWTAMLFIILVAMVVLWGSEKEE